MGKQWATFKPSRTDFKLNMKSPLTSINSVNNLKEVKNEIDNK